MILWYLNLFVFHEQDEDDRSVSPMREDSTTGEFQYVNKSLNEDIDEQLRKENIEVEEFNIGRNKENNYKNGNVTKRHSYVKTDVV